MGPHSCVTAVGLSAPPKPGTHHPFKIFLSSFTACLYMGAVALPTSLSLSLSGPMRQTSSRRSPKPIVDKRLVLRGGQLCKSLCLLLLICPCACPSPTAAAAHAREEHKECEQLCIDDEVIA